MPGRWRGLNGVYHVVGIGLVCCLYVYHCEVIALVLRVVDVLVRMV